MKETIHIPLPSGKKIYFLSDFHLGAPNHAVSLVREKKLVAFLEHVRKDAAGIFIVGDMFDFWYEYKTVVPRGFTRIFGKLAELTDSGLPIHFFVGNHDMWMTDYFQQELNIPIHFNPQYARLGEKLFFIGHGDGLGPHDKGYKMLKKIFRNPICHWAFGQLHPNFGIGLANYSSQSSRKHEVYSDGHFLGEDKEWLIIFAKEKLKEDNIDCFIFGHRHIPTRLPINGSSLYINLGDWIKHCTYAVFDDNDTQLRSWES